MAIDDENDNENLEKTSVLTSDTFKVRLAQAGQAPPCLVMLVGPANSIGRQWPIEDSNFILGRAPSANIFLDDPSVSKSHAKLLLNGGDVSVMDLESTNKTVINGKLVPPLEPVVLRNNDQIKVGNVILKFLERGNIETVSVAEAFDRGILDSLTGIHNKGAFTSKAPESFKKANLLDINMCIITFDIDHFKHVNDTYGHSAGDYVLQELARIIKSGLIRESDFFARTGGEEFCLILLGSGSKQCKEIAERIRSTVENHKFEYGGTKLPITISMGVALKRNTDNQWEEIFERADKALYKSKNNGRNLVTFTDK
ncbi:MAG: GGDEF domain-containing protein [Bdellovibrionales bacterium]|nr:GGDEF domain-containing protein [Bdellovibrionales bacterium]